MNAALPDPDEERTAILVVDDLQEKLLVVGTVLEPLGQELVYARSGRDALRELLQREFAVILLDVNMPDMDGLETAALIRRYKRTAHTPIIFITSYADEVQTYRGYELGAVDYILSPVIPEVLRSKVQVFVDLHRMQRRVRQQAEERVALADAEAARRAAEASDRRSDFLSRVSRVLGGSLDLELGMRALLRLIVPEVAPCAAVLVPQPASAGSPLLLCQGGMPGETPPLEALHVASLPLAMQQHLADALAGRLEAPVHWSGGGLPAGHIVPLRNAGQVQGALFVAGVDDLSLLGEIADRAAMAFANAMLYRSLQGEIVERRAAEQRLRQSNRRKDEFLAMLSHELRNPLAPIRNAVQVIRRVAPPDAKLSWATDVTDRQVTHLTKLVEELLDVARISQGKISLQLEALDLLAVIAQSVETARPSIDARHHRLSLQLPSTPVWLRGDFARLAQVLGNLLTNAAKYTPDGGMIQLSMTVEDGHAVIRVRDSGVGIDEELLPNVFELFEQGKRSLDRSQGGLGVGLTLVQRLVQMHHGQVEAHSDGTGQGSEFIVRLPCLAEVRTPAPVQVHDTRPVPTPGGCRVLVVDDNHDAADTVAMVLRMDGHSVETAHDGPQALASAGAYQPDVVVLDIGLPGLDGYEVARRLRQTPHSRDALLIALTGYGQKNDEAQALAAGFDRHLVKPADPALLSGLIAEWRAAQHPDMLPQRHGTS
jgi:signal transduction histidine kinase/DNA-binding response OmpR family regulator